MNKIERDKAIQRIKKCLALTKSANENEAAVAMQHAKALMDKFQIDESDPSLLGIVEAGALSGVSSRPPTWERMLVRVIANYFDCDIYFEQLPKKGEWKYMGIDPSPEIAVYAFDVLMRQLRKARKEYIDTQLNRVRNTTNKIARADAFCEGWIITASRALGKVKPNPEIIAKITHYKQQAHGDLSKLKVSERKVTTAVAKQVTHDKYHGLKAGENAKLHTAVNGSSPTELIGLGATS